MAETILEMEQVDLLDTVSDDSDEIRQLTEDMMTVKKQVDGEDDEIVQPVSVRRLKDISEDEEVEEGRHVKSPQDISIEKRADSIAFEAILDADGNPVMDYRGRPTYNCVSVARKPKHLFCTECHDYKVFQKEDGIKRCSDCGMSDQDFYVRTANQLWENASKK